LQSQAIINQNVKESSMVYAVLLVSMGSTNVCEISIYAVCIECSQAQIKQERSNAMWIKIPCQKVYVLV